MTVDNSDGIMHGQIWIKKQKIWSWVMGKKDPGLFQDVKLL